MESWFKSLVLGLGVMLGLAPARESPPMELRPLRDSTTLYAGVELAGLPGEELGALVRSSFAVRLTATLRAGSLEATAWREIRFDGSVYTITVSETGGTHRTASAEAAWAIVSRFRRLPLGPLSGQAFPLAIKCKAVLSLPGDDEYDPMLFWAYKPSAAVLTVDSLGEIPYY